MITSIASQKGGTGKTTTSLTIAAGLARLHHKRVLLIDMDSQANSSKVLLADDYLSIPKEKSTYATIIDKKPLPILPTSIDSLDIVPAHIRLSETDVALTTALDHREARLKKHLHKVSGQYDYVIIDCPPALSWLTLNAFAASDYALVVFSPGYFELDSIAQINSTIKQVQEDYNPKLELLGYLFNMSDSTNNSKVSIELMRKNFKKQVFKTVIPRNTAIRDAHFHHTDIFEHDPGSTSAQAYKKLLKEVFVHG